VKEMRYLLSLRRRRLDDVRLDRGFRQVEVLLRRRHQQLDEQSAALGSALGRQLALARHRLTQAGARVLSFDLSGRATAFGRRIQQGREALRANLERVVTRKQRQFAEAHVRFAQLDLRARVTRLSRQVDELSANLSARLGRALAGKRRRFEAAALQLKERSPFQLLERGYSIAYNSSGEVLRSTEQVALGDQITVRLAGGRLDATVRQKREA
jgi:exodeoxyribonuclease VII large subunit